MNFNMNTGGEALLDESNFQPTPDNLSEAFFYAYGAADSERMGTMQGLSGPRRTQRRRGFRGYDTGGGMVPGSALYSRFIRNAALGFMPPDGTEFLVDESNSRPTADNISEAFFYTYGAADSERMTTMQNLSGLGLTAGDVTANPAAYGFQMQDDGSWFNPGNGDSITTDGILIDTAGMVATGTAGVLQTGAVNPASVNTAAGSDWLAQILNNPAAVMQGITTLQLSQINLDRMQRGLAPLTTGQVLGVAGAPPAITTNTILLFGAGIVAVMLLGKK